jgi:hypothetical protein
MRAGAGALGARAEAAGAGSFCHVAASTPKAARADAPTPPDLGAKTPSAMSTAVFTKDHTT